MNIIKIRTDKQKVHYINADYVQHFAYMEKENMTILNTYDYSFVFEGDKAKELAKMLTSIKENNLMVTGEEWIETHL